MLCCRWFKLFVFLFLPPKYFQMTLTKSAVGQEVDTAGLLEGDIFLGGLFRIRKTNATNHCQQEVEPQVGIQRVEAMLYAVQKVNKDHTILPNVILGVEIRDTCSSKTKALDESLKFIVDSLPSRPNAINNEQCWRNYTKKLVGVIGPSRSTLSIEVAKLLRLFKVPQVSYASTSSELSKEKYSYFARTVPSDAVQVRAMADVVIKFGWKSVFTINSAGSYGENGINEFNKEVKKTLSAICVVHSEQVSDESTMEEYKSIINKFARFPSTRVIILFLKDNHVKMLLKAAKESGYIGNVWIASDEWGTRLDIVENMEDFFKQSEAITFKITSSPLKGFKEYFCSLNGSRHSRQNPWFQQYLLQRGKATCDDAFNDKLPFVMDAVEVFARALDIIYKRKCPKLRGLCDDMRRIKGKELRDLIFNNTFTGNSSREISIRKNGDSVGSYEIFHYSDKNKYRKIGEWLGQLRLSNSPAKFRNNITSDCSDNCYPWSRKILKMGTTCCTRCVDCPNKDLQYVENETTCVYCKNNQRSNINHTGCEDLPTRYVSATWLICITTSSILGILCSVITAILLFHNRHTPLVESSGSTTSFFLLVGVIISYVIAIVFVSKPDVMTCILQRSGKGLANTLCYATILMKIDSIRKIFAAKDVKSKHFTKWHAHVAFVLLIVSIEGIISTVGLIIKPPKIISVLPSRSGVYKKCNYGLLEYVTSYPYNLILIILCTIYSFCIRKVPSAFNESKHIALVLYSTCIIWLASLPVYLGTPSSYKPITIGLNTALTATTILGCFFGPKVYMLFFNQTATGEISTANQSSRR